MMRFLPKRKQLTAREQEARRRQKQITQQQRRARVTAFLAHYLKRVVILVVIMVLVAMLGAGALAVHSSQSYIVQNFEISGNQRITVEQVQEVVNPWQGASMLTFSKRQLEQAIVEKFKYLKSVNVKKVLPGTVQIILRERNPSVVVINLAGVYLVDDDGIIVGVVTSYQVEGLTFQQSQIVSGYGDVDSDLVRESYLSQITDETERNKVDWSKVERDIKLQAMEDLRNLLTARLESQIEQGKTKFEESEFKTMPVVYSYENNSYIEGEAVPIDKINYPLTIVEFANRQKDIEVDRMLWQSAYTLMVQLKNNKRFIFSSVDDINWQLGKWNALIINGVVSKHAQFDLRGEKVVAR